MNVTYTICLTPENAQKIDAINKILLGNAYTEESTPSKPEKAEKPAPVEKKTTAKAAEVSLDDLKTAAKTAKSAHGEAFCLQVLEDFDVEVGSTLGSSIKAIDESQYAVIIKAWEQGPKKSAKSASKDEDDFEEADDEDSYDDDEESEVTAESVKTALKAYSKEVGREEAKAIMNKHGAASLAKVDDLPQKKLIAMMKELV